MIVVGIDPGKSGFTIALDTKTNRVVLAEPTPLVGVSKKGSKKDYVVSMMRRILEAANPEFVVLEKQQAYRGQGVSSTFSIGRGFGLWEGLLAGMEVSYVVVTPRGWQKHYHPGKTGDDPKGKTIQAASQLFPSVDLRRTPRCRIADDGKADALLLAHYGAYYYRP